MNIPCGICSNKFEASTLKFEHIRAVHFKSKIKCELWEKSFPRQGTYQDHVKGKHADLGAERIEEWVARIDTIRADYENMDWLYE